MEGYTYKSYLITKKGNQCEPNPCRNDGICQKFGTNGYVCSCKPRYIGQNCTSYYCKNFITILIVIKLYVILQLKDQSSCSSNPCLNFATCIANDENNTYTCKCSKKYFLKNFRSYSL